MRPDKANERGILIYGRPYGGFCTVDFRPTIFSILVIFCRFVTKNLKENFQGKYFEGRKEKKFDDKKFELENFQISSKKAKRIINKITIVRKTSQI